MEPNDKVLDYLLSLSNAEIEILITRVGIPRSILPAASLAERATAIIEYARSKNKIEEIKRTQIHPSINRIEYERSRDKQEDLNRLNELKFQAYTHAVRRSRWFLAIVTILSLSIFFTYT